jgi:hypothetical protein
MAVTLHHLIIPATYKRASAQLFAEIFGLAVKGRPRRRMARSRSAVAAGPSISGSSTAICWK